MHSIENLMKNSLEDIKGMIDVNTIIGTPIVNGDEKMILPVSKVSLGLLTGGGEYDSKMSPVRQADKDYPFAGAAAAGISISPVAFLSVSNDEIRVMPVEYPNMMERMIDTAAPLIERLTSKLCKCNESNE